MKKLLILCLLLGTFSLNAQKPDTTDVRTPIIICKVQLGEIADFGNYAVRFESVVSDSRCPKNVTCVWAGEAKVLVSIYKNEELSETKEITIAPGKEAAPILGLENKQLGIFSLDPYPNSKTPKANKKYVLNLVVKEDLE